MIPISASLATEGYKKVGSERGVTVYRHKLSSIIELGADGAFKGSPQAIVSALLDYNRHAGAVGRVSESRILRRGKGWLLVYQRLELPVVSDRDFTLKVTWGEQGGVHWIRYRCVRVKGVPRRDGVVRLSHHQGSWQLRKAGGLAGRTQARFQVSSDISGSLPRWMARSGADDDIPGLFKAIQRLANRKKKRAAARRAP